MITVLISKSSFAVNDWLKIVRKSCDEVSFKLNNELELKRDSLFQAAGTDSLCGVDLLLQSNGLKIFLDSLPSRKDLRLFMKIIDHSLKSSCSFSDEAVKNRFSQTEEFNSLFDDIWNEQLSKDELEISRSGRKVDLKPWLLNPEISPFTDQESGLIKQVGIIASAKDPEIFPVDDKESAIWDGSAIWISSSVDQILFSQNYFKGKICGEITSEKLCQILEDKIIKSSNGYILPEAGGLSSEDIKKLNADLIHYEKKNIKKKLEKLTIEAGKLQEISYSMSCALFEGGSLSKITDRYMKSGISKAQLEVAALAVSGMLEIAATNRGNSLDDMQRKLKDKCKLSPEAAYAVASGFVNAAKEAKPVRKRINWLKLAILVFAISTVIWFFYLR